MSVLIKNNSISIREGHKLFQYRGSETKATIGKVFSTSSYERISNKEMRVFELENEINKIKESIKRNEKSTSFMLGESNFDAEINEVTL